MKWLLLYFYALGAVISAVAIYTGTAVTGSTQRERVHIAVVGGAFWLPTLIVLYTLRALAEVRQRA